MKTFLKRVIGLLLLILAFIGIIMCVVGGIFVFQVKIRILDRSSASLSLVLKALDTTEEGLGLAMQAVESASDSVSNLQDSLETAGSTLNNSTHFFDTATTLSGKTFPETITATREALDSAAASAKLVDDTLSFIAAIPLIGKQYNPDKPMSQALTDVSISLSNLPDTFKGVEDDFVEIKQNMEDLQSQLSKAQTQLDSMKSSLTTAKEVITKYQEMLKELKPFLKEMGEFLPKWLNRAIYGLILFLGWFALSQLGLIVQGIQLIITHGGDLSSSR